jgi:hypothetical protein
MTTDERLDRLSGIVETLAGAAIAHDSVLEAHDRQIAALIELADKSRAAIYELRASSADLERRWQAYLNTLRRQ